MKRIEGDLLALAEAGRFDVIAHGCNCFHTMGAGIAKAISTRYPQALAADTLWVRALTQRPHQPCWRRKDMP